MYKITKKTSNAIGVLGGTFDPPHKGHLHISKTALKKFKLDKIIWLVTKRNPLKSKPYLSLKKRIKLSNKIIKKEKKIFVWYLDNKFKKNNTYNLLKYIKKRNKKIQLYFLIGADNLINFHRWNKWNKIPNFAKIVVFSRKGYKLKALNSIASKKLRKTCWIYIKSKNVNISSSLIRKFW